MSGRKISQYTVSAEELHRQEERRRLEAANQMIREIPWIKRRIEQLNEMIENVLSNFESRMIVLDLNERLNTAERIKNSDPIAAGSILNTIQLELNGSERTIREQQKQMMNDKISRVRLENIGRELQQQEKEYRNQQLVEMRLAYFKEITENHPELIVDDVKARVDLLTNSIKANPENKNTLKQVHEFKIQFEEIIEKSKEEQSKFQFVKEAMIQAVGGTEKKGPDGGSSISGNINGATITVHISPDSNNVDFDTPEDGSCGNMMHTLTDRLVNQGIKLGPIKMRKTGRVLETAKSVYTPRRRIKQ